jgi:hypothetical protein
MPSRDPTQDLVDSRMPPLLLHLLLLLLLLQDGGEATSDLSAQTLSLNGEISAQSLDVKLNMVLGALGEVKAITLSNQAIGLNNHEAIQQAQAKVECVCWRLLGWL